MKQTKEYKSPQQASKREIHLQQAKLIENNYDRKRAIYIVKRCSEIF
jgi:hypothetical protein